MKVSVIRHGISIRTAKPTDHKRIVAVMTDWWDGRDLTAMLPRLFLNHFHDTVLVLEKENDLIGFLVGLLSQSKKDEAYVHFVGIHPEFRQKGLARVLYEHFFDICRKHRRTTIRACTSPLNTGSVAFHKKMGFQLEPGDAEMDGMPVTLDYNRKGDHKVLFKRRI